MFLVRCYTRIIQDINLNYKLSVSCDVLVNQIPVFSNFETLLIDSEE